MAGEGGGMSVGQFDERACSTVSPLVSRRVITLKNIEHALCEFEKYKNKMKGGRVFASRVSSLGPLQPASLNQTATFMPAR